MGRLACTGGSFFKECTGTAIMICCTFAPYPLVHHLGPFVEWPLHMCGVIFADWVIGGAHVDPAVTFAMWVAGEMPAAEAAAFVVAQLLGAILGFPVLQALLDTQGLKGGGPTFDPAMYADGMAAGCANEFKATASAFLRRVAPSACHTMRLW